MKCPKCGKEFDSRFCPDCGYDTLSSTTNEIDFSNIPKETENETCDSNVSGVSPEPIQSQSVPADQMNNNSFGNQEKYMEEPVQKEKWYKKTWVVILFLIFFWPVGLFLMWKFKPTWKTALKVVVTVLVAIFALYSCANMGSDSSDTKVSKVQETDTKEETKLKTEEKKEEKLPKITGISAVYSGSTEAGTVLDDNNTGITVTATYDDTSTKELSSFEIAEAATLQEGQTSTVSISAENNTCELSVTCTTVSPDTYKAQCQDIAYSELARNPDSYTGSSVKFTGEIIQVMEESSGATYRINVTQGDYGYWDDTVLVTYEYKEGQGRFLEDDIVTFYGMSGGLYTYESTMGANITVPIVFAEYIDLN